MTAALARPLAFDGLAARFHPADGDVAVLMVGAWGYEQFCMARNWRLLAERFAAAGYPTLRYDHPGGGDSLDPEDGSLAPFRAGLVRAVDEIGRIVAPRALVLVGQGLGATLILDGLPRLSAIDGVVALAPVAQGRLWLRELAAWSAMVGGADPGELSVGGFTVAPALAADLRGLDIRDRRPTTAFSLIAARAGRPDDAALAQGFRQAVTYDGYEAAIADPTASVEPSTTFAAVVDAVRAALPPSPRTTPFRLPPDETARLAGPDFIETATRFGPDRRLYGVLALPVGRPAAAVLYLNSGLDPHDGWSRIAVDQSRRLARAGYAAFRVDLSGCGEAPVAVADAGSQILYTDLMRDDGAAAMEFLAARGLGPTVVTGRCSGAFNAFHVASVRPETAGLVMINPLRLVWNPAESLPEAMLKDVRCRALQEQGLVDGDKLRRLLRGEISPGAVLAKLARLIAGRLPAPPWTATARLLRQARAMFRALSRQGTRTVFVSSDCDGSLDRFAEAFGEGGRHLGAYPSVSFELIVGADHNLNQKNGRARAFEIITATLADISGAAATAEPATRARSGDEAA